MKNLNLTGLYLALIAKYDVSGFNLSSIRKIGSNEPVDASIDFFDNDLVEIDLELVKTLVEANIEGEVKQVAVRLKDSYIHVYIEF